VAGHLQVLFVVILVFTKQFEMPYEVKEPYHVKTRYGEGCLMPWAWNNDDASAYAQAHDSKVGTVEQVRGEQKDVWYNPEYRQYHCWQTAYPWTTFVISVSQMYALYCLVHFYHGTHKALEDISPFAKFISIKMIVFFSFWQGLALSTIDGNTDWLDRPAIFLGLCEQQDAEKGGDPTLCAHHGGTYIALRHPFTIVYYPIVCSSGLWHTRMGVSIQL